MKKIILLAFLSIIYIFQLSGQGIENPGFEFWEDAGTVADEPVDWSSIKTSDAGAIVNNAAPVVWEKSTDAHSGNFSVKLYDVASFGIVATGIVTNGRVHADFIPANGYVFTTLDDNGWNTPYSDRPDSVIIWAKYTPVGNDTAQVKVLLHQGLASQPPNAAYPGTRVGFAQINIYGNVNSWTRFAAPFSYSSPANPDYVLLVLSAGAGTHAIEGSEVLYDDIQLKSGSNGIDAPPFSNVILYSSNGFILLENLPEQTFNDALLEIYSVCGSLIQTNLLNNNQLKIKTVASTGLYIAKISYQGNTFTKKLVIR